jgi:superfamily II helicase
MSESSAKDYFGTFLNTVLSGAIDSPTVVNYHAPNRPVDPLNAAVIALAARGGQGTIGDLLDTSFTSISEVSDAIGHLTRLGLASADGAQIRLTEAGMAVAQKLSAANEANHPVSNKPALA